MKRLWLLILLAGCASAPPPEADEPEVNAETVPSLALLTESGRPEDATSSGAGPSCEEIIDEERRKAREGLSDEEPPPEHGDAIKESLNAGTYLGSCSVPETAFVDVCAAIIDGAARGVTVTVNPGSASQADCVADAIRRLDFPSHALVAVARTQFEPH